MSSVVVVHYHWRPGGVRSVIGRSLSLLPRALGRFGVDKIVLAGGAELHRAEFAQWQRLHPEIELTQEVVAEFSYLAEQPLDRMSGMGDLVAAAADRLLRRHRAAVVWAHNFSVGRNVFLGDGWRRATADAGVMLWCQHHDWWPECRWERWPEMRRWGIRSLAQAARGTVPDGPGVRHTCVHPWDAALLQRRLGRRAAWLPNLSSHPEPAAPELMAAVRSAADGGRRPLWLVPSRLLRRKNPLEAVLLAALLRPDCRLTILGDASAAQESPLASALREAATVLGIDLDLGATRKFPVPALLGGAEVLLQTSVLEGFGLTALDAAAWQKPLLLRRLPQLTTALEKHLVHLPTTYADLALPPEIATKIPQAISPAPESLPPEWRALLKQTEDFPATFAGLTVAGQQQALPTTPCALTAFREANPWLENWRKMSADHSLPAVQRNVTLAEEEAAWLETVEQVLTAPDTPEADSGQILSDFARAVLTSASRHPLLTEAAGTGSP